MYKKGISIAKKADTCLAEEIASGRRDFPADVKPGTDFYNAVQDAREGRATLDLTCGPYQSRYTKICNGIGTLYVHIIYCALFHPLPLFRIL